jgi:hypothetical protein
MYRINETRIEVDTLIANVTLLLDEKTELVVNVPVLYPKDEATVLAAIEQLEVNEAKKFNAAPVLVEVKKQLDAKIGSVLTAAVK